MSKKLILLALVIILGSATAAMANGNFYGYVTYHNCTCSMSDRVCIRPMSGGGGDSYNISACGGNPGYTTGDYTYAPGWYYISVVKHQSSDCDYTFVETINHGSSNQQVDLDIYGPDGGGSRPDPGP